MSRSTFFVNEVIEIMFSEIEITYTKSSGPGGQNVNKVNSKAQLRWNVVEAVGLSADVKMQLLLRLGPKLNGSGELLITSDRFRDQARNREDCLEKLRNWVAVAARKPKLRKKTKPSRSVREKNKTNKRRHAAKKNARRRPEY